MKSVEDNKKKYVKSNMSQITKKLPPVWDSLFQAFEPITPGLSRSYDKLLQLFTMLNKQKDLFNTILSNMKDMIFIMDKENKIMYMNKAASDEYGASLGKNCYRVICNQEMLCQQNGMENVFKGQTVQLERTIKGKVYDSLVAPFVYGDKDLYKMEVLRDITGRKQLQNELEKLSITDKLTGMYNRRYFDDVLEKEVVRTRRLRHDLSLLFIDIDKFKHFNDVYGHAMGDKVLQCLANLIQTHIRKGIDVPCRYGGEEFTIMLPETSNGRALIVANRILKGFRNMKLRIPRKNESVKKTISIGIAGISQQSNLSIKSLLVHADKAMYKAKKLGGNRICG
ncbi:MAG: sensor domain-containing diguanylate cyclase [Candidatus Brocadiaceae bacterium]|nr:sensor domain-containing diguanylate cyclase [Candidatus Brocadiaceae bacterium]